jgi:uncharacterized protein YhaN
MELNLTMTAVLLDDLAQRISQQEAQLQALRRELETRQGQLAKLTQRKEQLLTQLQQIDAEIAAIATGAQAVKTSRAKPGMAKPARTVVIGGQPAGNGAAAQQAEGKPQSRGTPRDGNGRRDGRAGQPSLPELIVILLREAGRPLTVKELGQEIKRRGFRSQSSNFPKMLAVRVRELKRKGVLRGAVGQSGFVLAQPTNGKMQKDAQPVPRNTKSRQQKSVKQLPLREVLTQILKKSTKPMTGSRLAAEAVKAGYHSTSKNFVKVVWVAMSNLKNVEHVPNRGYRLKKVKA